MFDKNSTIEISDPAVWEIIQKEGKRQEDQIELIASENYASPAVCLLYTSPSPRDTR